jgi:hypothetical protein
MWTLSQQWYGDRLARDYRPKSAPAFQRILDDVGLNDNFWTL